MWSRPHASFKSVPVMLSLVLGSGLSERGHRDTFYCIMADYHSTIFFFCASVFHTDHTCTLAHIMRQGDHNAGSAGDFYSLHHLLPDCLSTRLSITLLVFESKNNTRAELKQWFLITSQHHWKLNRQNCNKIKLRCLFFSQFFIFIHRSVKRQSYFPSSFAAMRHSDLAAATQSSPLCSMSSTSFISRPITWQENMTSLPVTGIPTDDAVKKWPTVLRCLPLWSRCPLAVQEGT